MPRSISITLGTKHRAPRRRLVPLYAAMLLLIFHSFVVAYINSSYLEQFISTEAVGTIYTLGSALTVIIFLIISRVLHRVGNYKLTLALIILDLIAVTGMAFADSLRTAVPLFLTHLTVVPLIVFNLDVFLEAEIDNNEGTTGSKRGLLLTLTSFIGALSPFSSSVLVAAAGGSFDYAYLASALALIPILALLLIYFRDFSDPPYQHIEVLGALRTFIMRRSLRAVLIAHFALQMFFMCMVVYTPLYLTKHIGLSWTEFGIIMFFAQLAYVLFEYPIGIVADKYIGEKEMMGMGFLILAIATSWIGFLSVTSVIVWSIVMFISRVGASLVEVTTESYFFKHMQSSDAQIISFFRVTRPLAYLVGAMIASIALLYLPFNLLFIVFAFLMIPAPFATIQIVDSR